MIDKAFFAHLIVLQRNKAFFKIAFEIRVERVSESTNALPIHAETSRQRLPFPTRGTLHITYG
jgi:hypothetical protein